MGAPPIPPPQNPSLSAMMPGQEVPDAKGGSLVRLFYEVEKMLDLISSAAPRASQQIDEIKGTLRDVMTSVANGGANGKPSTGLSGPSQGGPY